MTDLQNTSNQSKPRTGKLMVVILILIIILLAMLIVIQNLKEPRDYDTPISTKATLRVLHEAVRMFKMDTGRYPTEKEGLNALIYKPADVNDWAPGGYLEHTYLPKDAWKHDFVYKLNPGEGEPFVIISYGADGKEGGKGPDADLRSTDLQ